jgi:tripartite-type tricarboxylate transporter receptor subunit TctC
MQTSLFSRFKFGLLWCWAVAAAMGMASNAWAQAYPSKPIKFVITHAAGGLPDTVARIYAQRLSERLGQPVTVDNRPGANGMVAAQAMALAPKDGYTFMVTDGSKAKPGTLTYGSSGIGSTHHLTMESMKASLGLEITHIPFKGTGQSVPALVGGQVDMLFSALPSLLGFVKSGQVRLLGNNAAKRSAQEPNVPAIAETIPGFDFAPIIAVFAATGTPAAAIERISNEMAAIAKMPEVVQTLSNAGIEAIGGSAAECHRAVLEEVDRLGKAVAQAGIQKE